MRLSPTELIGFEVNERLRIVELLEERPFAYFFRADVLALSRVVGSCSVTVYIPNSKAKANDVAAELRVAAKGFSGDQIYGLQEVGTIRHPGLGRIVYATGEPATTSLALEIAAARFVGWEVGEPVLTGAARALQEFHKKDRVHGRVRPHHLLKTGDGWKLAGHAVAAIEDSLERLVRVPEEPVYLPPENYRAGDYGPAVDTWALGICLHKASCGRMPYSEGEDLIEQMVKHAPRVERAPGRFGSVVRALLAAEPEERWGLQRVIDHIERPRGGEFQSGGPQGTPTQSTQGAPADGDTTIETPVMSSASVPVDRPLFARGGFLMVCLLAFLGAGYFGYTTARLPKVPKLNGPTPPPYSVNFSHTQVDPDGRVITKTPEQAVAYAEQIAGGINLEMMQIPPGAFVMGSSANEPFGEASERPQHQVTIGGFYISRFEVTQAQWMAVRRLPRVDTDMPENPSQFVSPDRPVEGVTWRQAREFCRRLSRQTGRLYRLPTEAEWEFACRGGTRTPFHFGETINSAMANYQATKPYAQEGRGEYRKQTLPVGTLGAANYFGLLDMHGNVAEWCDDIYGDYSEDAQTDPTGPGKGLDRVVRGGGWRSLPWRVRSASRVGVQEDIHRNDIGFRVVLPRVVMVDPVVQ